MAKEATLTWFAAARFSRLIDADMPGEIAAEPAGCARERHAEREIMLALAGEPGFVLAGKCFAALPGTVFFIDRWQAHQLDYPVGTEPCCHLWIHLHDRELLAGEIAVLADGGRQSHGIARLPAELLTVLNRRWEQAAGIAPEKRREVYAGMVRLLCDELDLLRLAPGAVDAPGELSTAVAHYIAVHYGRRASLAELEKFTGYNRYHLMRVFKRDKGVTIGEYINQVRRGATAKAVAQGLRQKEIAMQLGFGSVAAFWLWQERDRRRRQARTVPECRRERSGYLEA